MLQVDQFLPLQTGVLGSGDVADVIRHVPQVDDDGAHLDHRALCITCT